MSALLSLFPSDFLTNILYAFLIYAMRDASSANLILHLLGTLTATESTVPHDEEIRVA
jgi:hypothetical protein